MKNLLKSIPLVALLAACQSNQTDISDIKDVVVKTDTVAKVDSVEVFQYQVEQFADLRILRYQVPGFNELSLQQKTLLYYLSEAALCGRDIMWDQHYKYNLTVRKTLENIVETFKGDRKSAEFGKFMEYTKRVWFSNGIHHHYSSDKILPEFSKEYFASLVGQSVNNGFPYNTNENELQFIDRLTTIIFDPTVAPKRVNLDSKVDMVKNSAINFYEGVTQKEAEAFYKDVNKNNPLTPVMAGLNTKLVKENGKLVEKTWKVGGMYTQAVEKIVFWLEKAVTVAENSKQKDALTKLVAFYKSGSLKDFDDYSV
ncbi:MAG TPA: dihydrofolate reductase, partial [Bacteroidia bacterium]